MLAAAGVALLDPFVEAPFDVEAGLDVLVDEVEELEALDSDGSEGLGFESVTYQPDPLKMMPAG